MNIYGWSRVYQVQLTALGEIFSIRIAQLEHAQFDHQLAGLIPPCQKDDSYRIRNDEHLPRLLVYCFYY